MLVAHQLFHKNTKSCHCVFWTLYLIELWIARVVMRCTGPLGENDKILITCYVRPVHLPCWFFTNKFLAPLPGTCVPTQGDLSICDSFRNCCLFLFLVLSFMQFFCSYLCFPLIWCVLNACLKVRLRPRYSCWKVQGMGFQQPT